MQHPRWQPIDALPLLLAHIEEMVAGDEEQLALLREAGDHPYCLDAATVERVENVYSAQAQNLWVYEEQARLWRERELHDDQRRRVRELSELVVRLRTVNESILALVETLKTVTIERLLSKNDLEVGLEWVMQGAPSGTPLDDAS